MLHFPPFLRIHIPEAQDHLVPDQLRIVEGADIDPTIGVAEPALVISAVIRNSLRHPLADTLKGETLLKEPESSGTHHGANCLQKLGIRSAAGNIALQVIIGLKGLVGPVHKIDPVNRIERITQHMGRIIRPLHPAAPDRIPDGHECQGQEGYSGSCGYHINHGISLTYEDGVDGNGHHHRPAVFHGLTVDPAGHPFHILKGSVVSKQRTVGDPCQHKVGIGLQSLGRRLPLGHRVKERAARITQIVGAVLRQRLGCVVKCGILDIDVHGKYVTAVIESLGNGEDSLSGNGIIVHLSAHHVSSRLHSLAVPIGILILVRLIPLPGIGRHDLPVHYCVKIHHPRAQGLDEFGKMPAQPGLNGIKASAVAA